MDKLKLKSGIITGKLLEEIFEYCKERECAIPAVNVVGSNSIVAAIQGARESSSPIIIQFSNGGAHFNAGKFLSNEGQRAAIAGSIAGAHQVRVLAESYGVPVILHTDHAAKKLLPWVEGLVEAGEKHHKETGLPLYSSHMLDLSEESLEENLAISKEMLGRMAEIDMTLEIEIGVTGGEEDGVDNTDIDNSKLYTQPEDVLKTYDTLNSVGSFTVAAAFGNVHGVYKPGNVQLRPEILKNSQEKIKQVHALSGKPMNFVFHGGSGSTPEEIREAVSYGVVKMNIDTDTQWAFTNAIKKYMDEKDAYLHAQIGNPEGPHKPNKKQIDPRAWLHLGEKNMVERIKTAFKDLNSFDQFSF